jgi:hypothetical protein
MTAGMVGSMLATGTIAAIADRGSASIAASV